MIRDLIILFVLTQNIETLDRCKLLLVCTPADGIEFCNSDKWNTGKLRWCFGPPAICHIIPLIKQESPAVADKPARRLRKVCTVYVIAVGL